MNNTELIYKEKMEEILNEQGIEYKIKGEELTFCCPYHNDRHPSLRSES